MSQIKRPDIPSGALLSPLSLTPLLGATDSLIRALSLLVLLWSVGVLHHALCRLLRPLFSTAMHRIASTLLAALLVSGVELILQAYALALYQGLGIYLALIAIHCVVREETANSHDNGPHALFLFSGLMLALGVLREILGSGTLFSHAQWLFGATATHWEIHLLNQGWHLALSVPGGFILLGLLLVARSAWTLRAESKPLPIADNPASSSATKETLHP
ncbi:Rnf-Nqr domain containing protein [Pseudomonas sp. NA-150]|uniref:Rnf-Nqr domain containing protein n=1 Tax=Pseudomonas sp. NA-150 TaxID=3367525 RepID=UPI0037CCBB28